MAKVCDSARLFCRSTCFEEEVVRAIVDEPLTNLRLIAYSLSLDHSIYNCSDSLRSIVDYVSRIHRNIRRTMLRERLKRFI